MKYSEENIFALMERIGEHAGHPVTVHDTHRQIKIGDKFWPNLCFDLQPDAANLEQQIETFKQQIHEGSVPSVFMFRPSQLSPEMAHTFKRFSSGHAQWAAMTMQIDNWDHTAEDPAFEIQKASTEADMETWCNLTNQSLTGGSEVSIALFSMLKNDPDFSFLTALSGGKAVAGSMSFASDGKAGLYLISTLEGFRGQGLGRTITVAAVEDLWKQGTREIHLQATASGEPVYASLGFVRHGNVEVFNLK